MGRHLIPEIADALKAQGLLDKDAQFTSVDQLLDGLERTSSRLAATINTPPLDVAGLRKEWDGIRTKPRPAAEPALPRDDRQRLGASSRQNPTRQDRSVFETSSMMAVSRRGPFRTACVGSPPSARVGATRPARTPPRRCSITTGRRWGDAAGRVCLHMPAKSRQLRPYVPVRPSISSRRSGAPSPSAWPSVFAEEPLDDDFVSRPDHRSRASGAVPTMVNPVVDVGGQRNGVSKAVNVRASIIRLRMRTDPLGVVRACFPDGWLRPVP